MESRGICRSMVIPLLAAVAIVAILYWWPTPITYRYSLEELEEEPSPELAAHPSNLPSTSSLPKPWTLTDDDRADGVKDPLVVSIPQRYPAGNEEIMVGGVEVSAPLPQEPLARVQLAAPLVLEDVEFAGLRDFNVHTATTVSAKVSPRIVTQLGSGLTRHSFTSERSVWPETPEIDRRLEVLKSDPETANWAIQVQAALSHLRAQKAVGDQGSWMALAELDGLVISGIEAAEASTSDWAVRSRWLRTAYSLQRRVNIWTAIAGSRTVQNYRMVSTEKATQADVFQLVAAVRQKAAETTDPQGWARFLLLDEIEQSLASTDRAHQKFVAQRVLSRQDSFPLTETQQEWMDGEEIGELAAAIRPWAAGTFDLMGLLEQIEAYEESPNDDNAAALAAAVQALRFSQQPEIIAVAEQVNNHYRNANLRVCVSADLLERLLPQPPEKHGTVHQTVLGAAVRGQSVTQAKLGVKLLPADDAWNLLVQTRGAVITNTLSHSGPAHLRHQGLTNFAAETEIRIDRAGMEIGDPKVNVHLNNYLRSVASEYDSVPVIGPLVRTVAISRHEDVKLQAKRVSSRLAQNQIRQAIDEEMRRAARDAEMKLSQQLIGPLSGMKLNPLVVDLTTNEDRLQVRYRVAGNYQLAANSPRPRAWSNSVLSVQMHESTINNMLEQTLKSDRPLPLKDLWKQTIGPFGKPAPEDIPDNIRIQFAEVRPVVLRMQDNRFELTLQIARMEVDDRVFQNFVIRTTYRPEVSGLAARLVRDGIVGVNGDRLGTRDRLPIRLIFNKVFNEQRALPLTTMELQSDPRLADLAISQLETRDGWLAIALAPEESIPRMARLPLTY